MEGEDEESDEPRAFTNKKPWQKIIVLAAGSFMNVVCALLIMIIVTGVLGFTTTTVDTVAEDSPAAYSSLKPGDEIAAIDGKTVDSWGDVSQFIAEAEGEPVNVTVNRDGSDEDILDNAGGKSTGRIRDRHHLPDKPQPVQSRGGRVKGHVEYDREYVRYSGAAVHRKSRSR